MLTNTFCIKTKSASLYSTWTTSSSISYLFLLEWRQRRRRLGTIDKFTTLLGDDVKIRKTKGSQVSKHNSNKSYDRVNSHYAGARHDDNLRRGLGTEWKVIKLLFTTHSCRDKLFKWTSSQEGNSSGVVESKPTRPYLYLKTRTVCPFRETNAISLNVT